MQVAVPVMPRVLARTAAAALLCLAIGGRLDGLGAQAFPPMAPADTGGVGFHAIGLVTQARPAMAGEPKRELYLTQPIVFMHDPRPHLSGHMMLNFEAWTLEGGELNAGTWGEGFVDRRHPHTFLHEVVVSAHASSGIFGGSLTAGRGFVPFGSDDPMVRPFVKYPFNHHLAQILERWVGIGTARVGRFALEGALFNGDEPEGPRSTGRRSRFGDSYAARVTVWPWDALEVQASHAVVESPEHADGGGLDHRKWHASGRFAAAPGGFPVYALYEWARTEEHDDAEHAFTFSSTLFETAVDLRRFRVALRWERTTRPEEERLEDPFRSARPDDDATLLGVTRWSGTTLHVALPSAAARVEVSPFFEVGRLRVEEITGGLFDPAAIYGDDEVHWSLSAGLKVSAGVRLLRSGRYGEAVRGISHAAAGHP